MRSKFISFIMFVTFFISLMITSVIPDYYSYLARGNLTKEVFSFINIWSKEFSEENFEASLAIWIAILSFLFICYFSNSRKSVESSEKNKSNKEEDKQNNYFNETKFLSGTAKIISVFLAMVTTLLLASKIEIIFFHPTEVLMETNVAIIKGFDLAAYCVKVYLTVYFSMWLSNRLFLKLFKKPVSA